MHRGLHRKSILNGSIFIEGTGKAFQKSPGCGFTFLTSAHQVCLSGIMCAKTFYPLLTFLKVISSVVPLVGQMKACSTTTWGNDSSKPQAIPTLGMLKVSVKIYNILLSNINTSADVFSKKFHFAVPASKFLSWSEFSNVPLHSKHAQSSQVIGNIDADMSTVCGLAGLLVLSTGDMPDFEEKITFAVTLIITDLMVFALLVQTQPFINECVLKGSRSYITLASTLFF